MHKEIVALDTETYLLEDGLLAPPVVCGSVAEFDAAGRVSGSVVAPGEMRREKVAAVLEKVRRVLRSDATVAGANVAYDFGCLLAEAAGRPGCEDFLPLVFQAYAESRVHDVQVAQALHAIACGDLGVDPRTGAGLKGRYSLDLCVQLALGRADAKALDRWRLSYGLLADLLVDDWPEDARRYPVDDAANTLEVARAQLLGGGGGVTPGPHQNLGDLPAQCETALALHLGAMSGVRVDPDAVRALRTRVEREHVEYVRRHVRFFRVDGKEDGAAVKRAVAVAYAGALPVCPECVGGRTLSERTGAAVNCRRCAGTGLALSDAVPRTPAGGVRTDRDALVESGDPDLASYGDNEPEKIRETYLPWLERGLDRPLTLRPNVLVASGRTSYDGLVQLIPREGGVRECIRARGRWSGHLEDLVFCSVDYAAIELVALAQVCLWVLGRSRMAEVICETRDPGMLHSSFGASLAGWSVEEMVVRLKAGDKVAKNNRWAAKACYHPDVEILTRRCGDVETWVKMSELSLDDVVASVSFEERRGCAPFAKIVWTRPLHLTRRRAERGLVALTGHGVKLRVTPDHGMPQYDVSSGAFVRREAVDFDWNLGWFAGWCRFGWNVETRELAAGVDARYTKQSVAYDGDVFCLTVPSGYVLVRDGGQPVVSSNCNFGIPGGMGAAKFTLAQRLKAAGKTTTPDGQVIYPGLRFCVLLGGAERCGVERVTEWRGRPTPAMCRACVEIVDRELRPAWFREWPEIRPYHAWVSAQVDAGGTFPCFVPGPDGATSSRVRGGLGFSDGANLGFQALAADGGKAAYRALTRECYLGQRTVYGDPRAPVTPRYTCDPPGTPGWQNGRSPLLGCRLPFFVHDEVVAEVPLSRAHEVATRMVEVMEYVMQAYVPDVPVRAEPALMFRWSKAAEPRRDAAGRLVPWDLKEVP